MSLHIDSEYVIHVFSAFCTGFNNLGRLQIMLVAKLKNDKSIIWWKTYKISKEETCYL